MSRSESLTARVSSKGQIAIPKTNRDRLGLKAGVDVAVRIEGEELVLRKVTPQSWRRWEGRLKGTPLLQDLAAERKKELGHDAKRA